MQLGPKTGKMAEFDDLNEVRLRLVESLGEQSKRYFDRMKLWFKMKISKEEFDLESRKQLTKEQVHLHNQFLLCLFHKCQGLAQASRMKVIGAVSVHTDSEGATSPSERAKKAKLSKKRNHTDRLGFEPVEVIDYLPTLQPPTCQATEEPQRNCAHELFLPDQAFLMGRLMLAAWERGLDGANEAAADYLVCAVQQFLKTVLVAILSQRSAFKTHSKYFVHSIGKPVPNPWLRNTSFIPHPDGPTDIQDFIDEKIVEDDEYNSIHIAVPARLRERSIHCEEHMVLEAACSNKKRSYLPPVSVWNLLDALQVHKSSIMSQSVYSINVERILTKLSHPSWDDEEAAVARAGERLS